MLLPLPEFDGLMIKNCQTRLDKLSFIKVSLFNYSPIDVLADI